MRLILASGSPRRRQLLEEAGYDFQVVLPADHVEPQAEGLAADDTPPAELVSALALAKLRDVARSLAADGGAGSGWLVLAADTVAACEGRVLGKPRDAPHAREILSTLSGRPHRVLTGLAMATLRPGSPPEEHAEVVETLLEMAPLGDAWLDAYLDSGAWEGKAGAFGYQDGLGVVRIVEGSASNVVGLPMERVAPLLAERGVRPRGGR